ncbi:hypothetical protein AAMO2058_000564200 [Amorphochlora amoebiformis]
MASPLLVASIVFWTPCSIIHTQSSLLASAAPQTYSGKPGLIQTAVRPRKLAIRSRNNSPVPQGPCRGWSPILTPPRMTTARLIARAQRYGSVQGLAQALLNQFRQAGSKASEYATVTGIPVSSVSRERAVNPLELGKVYKDVKAIRTDIERARWRLLESLSYEDSYVGDDRDRVIAAARNLKEAIFKAKNFVDRESKRWEGADLNDLQNELEAIKKDSSPSNVPDGRWRVAYTTDGTIAALRKLGVLQLRNPITFRVRCLICTGARKIVGDFSKYGTTLTLDANLKMIGLGAMNNNRRGDDTRIRLHKFQYGNLPALPLPRVDGLKRNIKLVAYYSDDDLCVATTNTGSYVVLLREKALTAPATTALSANPSAETSWEARRTALIEGAMVASQEAFENLREQIQSRKSVDPTTVAASSHEAIEAPTKVVVSQEAFEAQARTPDNQVKVKSWRLPNLSGDWTKEAAANVERRLGKAAEFGKRGLQELSKELPILMQASREYLKQKKVESTAYSPMTARRSVPRSRTTKAAYTSSMKEAGAIITPSALEDELKPPLEEKDRAAATVSAVVKDEGKAASTAFAAAERVVEDKEFTTVSIRRKQEVSAAKLYKAASNLSAEDKDVARQNMEAKSTDFAARTSQEAEAIPSAKSKASVDKESATTATQEVTTALAAVSASTIAKTESTVSTSAKKATKMESTGATTPASVGVVATTGARQDVETSRGSAPSKVQENKKAETADDSKVSPLLQTNSAQQTPVSAAFAEAVKKANEATKKQQAEIAATLFRVKDERARIRAKLEKKLQKARSQVAN